MWAGLTICCYGYQDFQASPLLRTVLADVSTYRILVLLAGPHLKVLKMSVSYAPRGLSVPAGFEYILESLAREVLREQPKDIIAFAAEYFKAKLIVRDGKKSNNLA